MLEEVVRIVQYMFQNPAENWEDTLRTGMVIPLFKKGERDDPNNYREVCLLSLGSRILARITAVRISLWAEDMQLLDDDQQGFRKTRSTADATQMMVRLKEDAKDLKRRKQDGELEDKDTIAARLLDLKIAYPRVKLERSS